jgi:hypothetical protein
MPVGDIKISTLKVGDLDLTNYDQVSYSSFNVYEDILSVGGPTFDVNVVDHSDALGKTKFNGAYNKDIEVSFSLADAGSSESVSFKFKPLQNANLDDGASSSQGSGHSKQYQIRGVSQEMLNAQGNFVEKSYNELTSKVVEDIIKNNLKTDKKIQVDESTKGKKRVIFSNEHPFQSLRKLNELHVGSESKSSCFVCFQQQDNNNQKYVFTTFEKLFQQQPVVTLKQTTTLDYGKSSETDKQNSIMWIKVPSSFFTLNRSLDKSLPNGYDPTTGIVYDEKKQPKDNFYLADGTHNSVGSFGSSPRYANGVPSTAPHDSINNKNNTFIADGKKNKQRFLSHLTQNYGTLEVPGNPKIKLGSMIELQIPKKSNSDNAAGETQFNGKALVVSIKHKIKPLGQSPRYTMVLGVVKGSYKEGGGQDG